MRWLQVLCFSLAAAAVTHAVWRSRRKPPETTTVLEPAAPASASASPLPVPRWTPDPPPARAPAGPFVPGAAPDPLQLQALLRERRFDELTAAVEGFQDACERDPQRDAWADVALRAFASADPAVLPLLDEWARARAGSFAPLAARAAAHFKLGFEARGHAVADATPAAQLDAMQDHFAAALPDLRAALARRPRLVFAHELILAMAAATSSASLARDAYRAGTAACPACARIRQQAIWFARPRWGGSRARMAELVAEAAPHRALNPRLAVLEGYLHLDRCADLAAAGSLDAALRECDAAVAAGDDHNFLEQRARVHRKRDDDAAALADLERAVTVVSDMDDLLAARAEARARAGRFDDARADLERIWLLRGPTADGARAAATVVRRMTAAAWQAHQARRDDEALALLDEAVAVGAARAVALTRRARLHQAAGRADDALRDAEAALADDRGDYDACKLYDDLLARRGELEPIVPVWDAFIALAPEDGRGYAERAGTLHHLGRDDEARADLHRACELGHKVACSLEARLGAR